MLKAILSSIARTSVAMQTATNQMVLLSDAKQHVKTMNGFIVVARKMSNHWGYRPPTVTPDKWHNLFPVAKGPRQSPVDIVEKHCVREGGQHAKKLVLKYNPADFTHLTNNGKSVTFFTEGTNSVLSGGILKTEHRLLQFHFHWGSEDSRGSEHTLNGKEFAAEIHLVHLNMKYKTFEEALGHGDGLCVIGAFLEAADKGAPGYDRVTELIQKVQHKDQTHKFHGGFDVKTLLPDDLDTYTTYDGSLTTPPLSECVQWVNLIKPVKVSRKNLAAFRSLRTCEQGGGDEALVNNNRPVQAIHERRLCFHCA